MDSPLDRLVGPDYEALMLSYEDKLTLVVAHGWENRGDWNNWFRPGCGRNYDLRDAVACILRNMPNKKMSAPIAPSGDEK